MMYDFVSRSSYDGQGKKKKKKMSVPLPFRFWDLWIFDPAYPWFSVGRGSSVPSHWHCPQLLAAHPCLEIAAGFSLFCCLCRQQSPDCREKLLDWSCEHIVKYCWMVLPKEIEDIILNYLVSKIQVKIWQYSCKNLKTSYSF